MVDPSTIVDRPRTPRELRAAFDQAGLPTCEVVTVGPRFTAVIAST
jgi:hypothetical protein